MAPLAEAVRDFVAGPPPGASSRRGAGTGVSMLVNPGSFGAVGAGAASVEQGRRLATAWACVRLISQLCGTLPTKVVKRGDKSRTEVRNDHTRVFWDRPNPAMTGPTYWTQQFMSSLTYGNPYAWKGREGVLNPSRPWEGIRELHPFHPKDLQPVRGPNAEKLFLLRGDVDERGEQIVRTTDEIAHTPYLSQDGYTGLSPIAENAVALGIGLRAQAQEGRQITEGLRTPGVLTSDAVIEQADAQLIVERWMENKTGQNQRPIVLGKGAKFEPITITPQDAQLLEVLGYFAQDIPLQIYGVPPHMVSIVSKSTSWGSGIEQMFIGFLVTVALPFLIPFEELYSTECLDPDLQLKFTVANLLRGDMNARANFYRTLRMMGVLSADTILELEDLAPRGIEDDFLSPQNMLRLLTSGGAPAAPATDDAVSFAQAPLLAEARCPSGCGTLLTRDLQGTTTAWCRKCKAEQVVTSLPAVAMTPVGRMVTEHAGQVPRDEQDIASQVAEILAERLF